MRGVKVLVSAPYLQADLDRYRQRLENEGFELIVPRVRERLSASTLIELVADIEAAVCGDDEFTREVIQRAKRLRVICKWGTGVDSIDIEAARDFGIVVRNTPGAFTEPVADTTLGYILAFARGLFHMDCDMKAGKWLKRPGTSLSEMTLGIIGLGSIGQAVATRALGFGMRVLGTDVRNVHLGPAITDSVTMVSLERLVSEADFVSLHCDLNPSSYHIVGRPEFECMNESAVLVNTARGPLVDGAALVEALELDLIAGAALDVFETEPLPRDHPLRGLKNILLAPHNANSSPACWDLVHERTIDMLVEEVRKSI